MVGAGRLAGLQFICLGCLRSAIEVEEGSPEKMRDFNL